MTPDEFTSRFAELRGPVARFLARRVEPGDVDDIAAEVFGVAWRKGASVTVGEELPWLYRIAGNFVANHRRTITRRSRFISSLAAPDNAPSAESIAIADVSLAEAWKTLPTTSREILALVAFDGLTVSESARALDISPNAASVRLNRARTQLKEALAAGA